MIPNGEVIVVKNLNFIFLVNVAHDNIVYHTPWLQELLTRKTTMEVN
jgi:uncharacterized protein (DUF2342 family)